MDDALSNVQPLEDDLSDLFGEAVQIEVGQRRQFHDAELSIVDMGYSTESRSSGRPTTTTHIRQTAMVSQDPQLHLPAFSLAPTARGIAGALLSVFGDMGDINFSDSKSFSEAYHLHAWKEEPVRLLFSRPLREHLAKHTGWNVIGKKNVLVIYHHDKVVDGQERERFVDDGLELLSFFQQAEETLDRIPELDRDIRPADLTQTAERMGGIAGTLLAAQLAKISLTKADLDQFARSVPPRRILPKIQRQVLGSNLVLVCFGLMFFVVGTAVGAMLVLTSEGAGRMLGIPFLLFFPLVGGLITFFSLRHRIRKRRTLRHGALVNGLVEKVERTDTTVNDQRRYHVSVRCSHEGKSWQTTLNTYGWGVERANEFLERDEPMRLLVDPKNPEHVIGLDLLMLFDS